MDKKKRPPFPSLSLIEESTPNGKKIVEGGHDHHQISNQYNIGEVGPGEGDDTVYHPNQGGIRGILNRKGEALRRNCTHLSKLSFEKGIKSSR